MSGMVYGWAPITKVEDQPDGTVIVHGPMTSAALDRDQQRFSQDFLDRAVPQWFNESGNIREQHDPKRAVGNALVVKRDDNGVWECAAHVVDPVAITKVRNKVLKGFSIGVKNPHITFGKADAPAGEIDDGIICENSLVDRPSNPGMVFQIVKADGDDAEHLEFEPGAGLIERADEPDLVKEVRHAPPGSSNGGQFLPGGTSGGSGVEANREGAEKVKVSPSGVSSKGGAGGKGKTAGKTSTRQMEAVLRAMEALGIKSEGMSEADAIKALQKKLGLTADGKMSPALAVKIRTLLAEHRAAQVKARKEERDKATAARRTEREKAAAAKKAAARKADELEGDDMDGDEIPDESPAEKADAILTQLEELLPDVDLVKYDEVEDIAGAKEAIACIARLIQSEAEELALGRMEEARDIEILLQAVDAMRYFLMREEMQAEEPDTRGTAGDGEGTEDMAGGVTMAKTDDTKPADDGAEADTTKVDEADLEKVDVPGLVKAELEAGLAKMDLPAIVKAAVAEATAASEERFASLEAQVAKALAQPEPGGPVQIRTAPQQALAKAHETETVRAQIADLMTKADQIGNSDPKLREGYLARAEALERTLVG